MSDATITHVKDEDARRDKVRAHVFLYVAFDCEHVEASSSRHALAGVDEIVIGRAERRSVRRSIEKGTRLLSIGLPDRWLSGTHARLSHVLGCWMLEDAKSKNGTFLNGILTSRAELTDGDVIEVGHVFFVFRRVGSVTGDAAADVDGVDLPQLSPGLGTLLPHLAEQFAQLARIACSSVAVMVHGETGTGKELVARSVHRLSGRTGAFVTVNCGALVPTLIEGELFGHRRGSFSGANEDRPGLVRAAHRGTLFLDEIGDLPVAAQPAFLRVLQEGEVMPVGATQAVQVDLRIVAATHRDLDALVVSGSFRPDLLARLRGFSVTLPPLRDRLEELGMIATDLLARLQPERAPDHRFALEAGRALMLHDWPLNVRELEKCLGAAVVLAEGGPVEVAHLPEGVRRALELERRSLDDPPQPDPMRERVASRPLSQAERRRDQLSALLREHQGNVSAVARALGKARVQVQRWIKRYGLDTESFRS